MVDPNFFHVLGSGVEDLEFQGFRAFGFRVQRLGFRALGFGRGSSLESRV